MFLDVLRKAIFILVLFLIFLPRCAWAWVNSGFETGDLTGWVTAGGFVAGGGSSGGCLPDVSVVSPGPAVNTTAGLLNDVHAGNYACQIFSGKGDPNHQDWAQVSQSDTVLGGGNSTLSFWFAGVFENYHYSIGDLAGDAYLQINIIAGGINVASLNYNWANNFGQILPGGFPNPTYLFGDYPNCDSSTAPEWGYVSWTNYAINLSGYVGQQVTLQATMYDCDGDGHYGVGYLDDVSWVPSVPSQVTLTKSNSPTGYVAASIPITYTLSYSNPASSAVVGVEINDTIPTGTTLVPGSISSNPSMPVTSQIGNDLIWNINYLAAGASGTLSFTVLPSNVSGAVTNAAQETDLDSGNIASNSVVNLIPTFTPTATPTITPTPTNTATVTATFSPTNTCTVTPTYTPTCVTYVWPDPYNPKTAVNGTLKISCMNSQTTVSIFTISGELVKTLTSNDPRDICQFPDMWGMSYCWDGQNEMRHPVVTGIYFYVVQQGNKVTQSGKFLLVNKSQ